MEVTDSHWTPAVSPVDHFKLLEAELPRLQELAEEPGSIAFLAQECMRFYSLADLLKETFSLTNTTAEERYITHILGRSLLEGFFWVIYIFDSDDDRASRYEEKLNAFRREYGKLWAEKIIPHRTEMDPPGTGWSSLQKPKDINSMLAQLKNDHGDRLNYLYFLYRVASFDTHGNSLSTFFESAFEKDCNFSTLDFAYGIDLIANTYLVILRKLCSSGEI